MAVKMGIIVPKARPGVHAPPCWLLELAEPVRADILTPPEPYLGLASQAFLLCQGGCNQPPREGTLSEGPMTLRGLSSLRNKVDIACTPLLELGERKGPETKGDA